MSAYSHVQKKKKHQEREVRWEIFCGRNKDIVNLSDLDVREEEDVTEVLKPLKTLTTIMSSGPRDQMVAAVPHWEKSRMPAKQMLGP